MVVMDWMRTWTIVVTLEVYFKAHEETDVEDNKLTLARQFLRIERRGIAI